MLKHLLRGGGSGLDGNSWVATLGGSGDDYGRSVAIGPDGSVYVCGEINSAGARKTDLLLAKFSSSGTVQWQKTLYGSNYDFGYSVAVAPDGSVYVCGRTYMGSSRGYDLLLAKFNSSGTVQWQKALGGRGGDYGYSVAVAPDGSVYVCGYTEENTVGDYAFLLAKFSSSGTMQWQKILGSHIKFEMGQYVAVAPDGYVYVCGYTADTTSGNPDLLLVKCSSSGTVQWQKNAGYSVAVAPDGSIYVCGETKSSGAGGADLLLAKITDSIIEKGTVTFGNFTFKDASLTAQNSPLTVTSSSLAVSTYGLTVTTPSLTVGTPSLTTNLYTL